MATVEHGGLKPRPKGYFDKELRIFCDGPKDLDIGTLRFLRFLAEKGKLEHKIFGAPAGPLKDFADETIPAPIINRKIHTLSLEDLDERRQLITQRTDEFLKIA